MMGDGNRIDVNPMGETTVQGDFFQTVMPLLFEARKIQEPQIHRFFDFVDKRACQKDRRDVGLTPLDSLHRVRVEVRLHHGLENLSLVIFSHVLSFQQAGSVQIGLDIWPVQHQMDGYRHQKQHRQPGMHLHQQMAGPD